MPKSFLTLALLLAAGVTSAADPVTDAMQNAYGPYRVALFKTNGNSPSEARQAITQAQQSWDQIAAQFGPQSGKSAPAPYDRDRAFATSLTEVNKVYAKAAEEIGKNQLSAAHETLEHAREVMADLRHRNQVIVYSDHMNAYHAQMELIINSGSKTLAEPNGIFLLASQAGALGYLADKLKSEAPSEYAGNGEFTSLYKAVDMSVADLQAALAAQDTNRVKDAIGKLKVPYSRMFIKFG